MYATIEIYHKTNKQNKQQIIVRVEVNTISNIKSAIDRKRKESCHTLGWIKEKERAAMRLQFGD